MLRAIKALNHPWVLKFAALLSAGLFLSVLITTLIFPEPLGLADNHDYWRLMNPFGLIYPDSTGEYYQYISLVFLKSLPWHIEIFSSGVFFVGVAYIFTWIGQWNFFPLILLGIVHCFFYTWAYYLFIKNTGFRHFFSLSIFAIISLLFLSDIFFTAYFNSFYQESSGFILLLFFVALFQSQKVHFWWEWLMIIGISFSKISHITFLLLFVPLGIKYWYRIGRFTKVIATILACGVILFVQSTNQDSASSPNVFNSFFRGLVHNQDSEQILNDFGLDVEAFKSFFGKDFWQADLFSVSLKSEFYQKVSHTKIGIYYLSHPVILLEKLGEMGRQLVLEPRPGNLANRSKAFSQQFVLERSITSFWQKLLPYILLPGLLISLLQVLYVLRKKYYTDYNALLLLFLPIFFPLQLLVSFIGDGWHEFAKHNVTFYFIFVLWLLLTGQFWYQRFSTKRL